ncbi:rep [Clostridium sp. CAG:264]|nr:rep [Clostridium sp. CAG:264]
MKEKKGEPSSWRTCEIVQQLEYMSQEDVEAGLDHNAVQDYAYILHDKDVHEDGTPVAPHWHIMIRFKRPVQTESLCKWFGIKSNMIGYILGTFGDAVAYLTHRNKPEKYQYLDEEIKSNYDFKVEVEKALSKKKASQRKEEIIELIRSGIVREYNYTEYITALEYDKFKRAIDNAFTYRRDTLKSLDRHMNVIYIYGGSGTGKTTYAKQLAINKGLSCYISSGSNDPLDGYKGQDCLILDDIRPGDFLLSDFLKILDNNTQSTVKSRYKNKLLECQYLIVTTSFDIPVFFDLLLDSEGESVKQMERRCTLKIQMNTSTMTTYVYQPVSGKYKKVSILKNPVSEVYNKRDLTDEECQAYVDSLLLPGKEASLSDLGFKADVPPDVALAFEQWNQEEFKQDNL